MKHTHTDCRSDVGRAVGLIDSIISIARAAVRENLDSYEVQQALTDLQQDEDLASLLSLRSDDWPLTDQNKQIKL
jgi:hypothetical protein